MSFFRLPPKSKHIYKLVCVCVCVFSSCARIFIELMTKPEFRLEKREKKDILPIIEAVITRDMIPSNR